MKYAVQHPELTHIFPVQSEIEWNDFDVDRLDHHLTAITRTVEPRVKNLELAIKSIANKDKKKSMENNLNSIVTKWHDHCKRLGTTPIGLYRCKVVMKNGQIIYWEFPKGFIIPDNKTFH